jgi:hypothetical protein
MRLAVLIAGGVLFAQLDRGTITGTVSDKSGSVVANAAVIVINAETGASYRTNTTGTGQYTMPNLPPGKYEVSAEAQGFNKLTQKGVELRVTEVIRVDATLEVGAVTQAVEVTAEIPRLQTDTPEVGTNLGIRQMVDLPMAIGNGGRTPEDLAYKITPGISGNSWQSYIVGGTAVSKETLLDGASVTTTRSGHFGESAISMESLQEFKIQTNPVAAEFGRSQGGVMNYVLKSGTNEFHGSGFGMLRNEAFNANTFANNARGEDRALDRKWNYAFSGGGPVQIPKVYNGRDKTFFYASYERYHESQLGFGVPSRTVPIPEFYAGDFSRLLGPVTRSTDALGNPVYQGAIYDPATFSQLAGGRWIGQMFPGNRIPASRISRVSQNLNEIARKYYLPTVKDATGQYALVNNALFPQAGIPIRDQWQVSVKGDQNINDYHKVSGSYSMNRRPRMTAQPQGVEGMWARGEPYGGPLARTLMQYLLSHYARLAHDWTITPTVLNHAIIYYNRFRNDNSSAFKDVDGAKAIGLTGVSNRGYINTNWGGGPFVALAQPGSQTVSFDATSSWGLLDSISFSRGRHFLKAGFDYRRNQNNNRGNSTVAANFNARGTAIPNESFSGNQTGYSFASYLLGIVDSASIAEPNPMGFYYKYYSLFLQDDFKVNSKLTLNLGLRWDYASPLMEVANRLANWNPSVVDPLSGLPGAYEFAGNCQQCNGKPYVGNRDWNNYGPRAGFAYRLFPKVTLRGAYAIFFEATAQHSNTLGNAATFAWIGTYALGADPVEPWRGIFNWDNGFPAARAYRSPSYDRSWGNSNRPGMYDQGGWSMPYVQRGSLNIQYEPVRNLVLDVGYLGTKGTGLHAGELNVLNQLPTSALAQYGANLNAAVRNEAEAARYGIRYPFAGFRGTVASALRHYPQVFGNNTINVRGTPLGFSNTQSLQVTLDKRFSRGLTAYGSYVWSKTMSNVWSSLESDNADKPQDYYNLKLEKAVADFDIPHMFKAYVAYELPFGKGKALWGDAGKFANAVVGGWSVSGILNYFSGQPLGFAGSTPLSGGWNGVGRRINITAGEMKASGFSESAFDLANTRSPSNTYLNKALYSDIAPLTLGTSAYRYTQARGFGTVSEDLGLQKNQVIKEKYRLQIRAEFLNMFNRHQLGGINTSITSPLFGQVTSVGGNRSVQLGARLDF